jgi:hypothetical protein
MLPVSGEAREGGHLHHPPRAVVLRGVTLGDALRTVVIQCVYSWNHLRIPSRSDFAFTRGGNAVQSMNARRKMYIVLVSGSK